LNVQTQSTNTKPVPRRPFDAIWWARRGGLIVALLVILVFGAEATLATQRRRDVTLVVSVQTAQVTVNVTPTSVATGIPGEPSPTPTPIPDVIQLLPADRLTLLVKWTYHIGPRFPHTIVSASAAINGRTVSSGDVLIDCGAAVIDCGGQQALSFAYTVPDTGSGASTVDWPSGDYVLIVTRSDGGLNPYPIGRYNFHVK
jgi:hypothetical protein